MAAGPAAGLGASSMIRRTILGALLALAGTEAQACTIRGSGFYFSSPGPWTFGLYVEAGKACTRTFNSGGQMIFKRLYVLDHPARGTVTLREGGFYTYTPPPGFQGRDEFQLQVCGEQRGQAGCADLKMLVTVN